MNLKLAIGLALAFLIGLGCRAFGIPSPAPLALIGALLVLAMTLGYQLTDRGLGQRLPATTRADCGGPSGQAPSEQAP
jgi:XapX domain-containing protein